MAGLWVEDSEGVAPLGSPPTRRLVLAACPHRGTQHPHGGPSAGLSALASVSLVSWYCCLKGVTGSSAIAVALNLCIPWLQPTHVPRKGCKAGRKRSVTVNGPSVSCWFPDTYTLQGPDRQGHLFITSVSIYWGHHSSHSPSEWELGKHHRYFSACFLSLLSQA